MRNPAMMGTGLGGFRRAFLIILTQPMKTDRVRGSLKEKKYFAFMHWLKNRKTFKWMAEVCLHFHSQQLPNQAIVSLFAIIDENQGQR